MREEHEGSPLVFSLGGGGEAARSDAQPVDTVTVGKVARLPGSLSWRGTNLTNGMTILRQAKSLISHR
jgi:hypothetical protein